MSGNLWDLDFPATYCPHENNTPSAKVNLSSYEIMHGRPFLSGSMITDPEMANLIKYFNNPGQFQMALREYGSYILPMPGSNTHSPKVGPDQVLIKTRREDSPTNQ